MFSRHPDARFGPRGKITFILKFHFAPQAISLASGWLLKHLLCSNIYFTGKGGPARLTWTSVQILSIKPGEGANCKEPTNQLVLAYLPRSNFRSLSAM